MLSRTFSLKDRINIRGSKIIEYEFTIIKLLLPSIVNIILGPLSIIVIF